MMAKRGRGGRPKKAGERTESGRLRVVVDRGNDRVQQRVVRFHCFQGGKASHQVHDQIGRVWAVGLLDGREVDATILRDKGREYGERYWQEYAHLAPRMFEPVRRGRGAANDDHTAPDLPGTRFARLDDAARAAGHVAFTAMHGLCVNEWWFPDANVDWVDRLINGALARAGRPVAGEIERGHDLLTLARAIDALVTMAGTELKGAR